MLDEIVLGFFSDDAKAITSSVMSVYCLPSELCTGTMQRDTASLSINQAIEQIEETANQKKKKQSAADTTKYVTVNRL